jgi:hypothetical protein
MKKALASENTIQVRIGKKWGMIASLSPMVVILSVYLLVFWFGLVGNTL